MSRSAANQHTIEDISDLIAHWPRDSHIAVTSPTDLLAYAGDLTVVKPVASVTKLFTTYAILIAIERGYVTLDDICDGRGATLGHLLSHSSGLGFSEDTPVSEIAKNRIYSNIGIELAAAHLINNGPTGNINNFGDYLHEVVLAPLAMYDTTLEGSAASGLRSSLQDLIKFGRELLAPTLISRKTLGEATSVIFEDLGGVLPGFGLQRPCPWGLGFEIKGSKNPHWMAPNASSNSFGHFGQSGAYLFVEPESQLAITSLSAEPFGQWAKNIWPPTNQIIIDRFG